MVKFRSCVQVAVLLLAGAANANSYAVLTHEAVVDSVWDDLKAVLVARFPAATPDDLQKAHAYAYGGCIIQDMGYYPFGNHFFSDLLHYVRSGDFVMALLRDAQDLNETAFALGALAHYSADNTGHSVAVNRAVAIEYPKLRARYGDTVTYGENPTAHLKTEFGFDVVQVAQGNYASQNYRDFIGFQVSKDLLERAFRDTYSLELKKQFTSLDLALGTFRRTVSTILPEAARAAWALKKNDIVQAHPGATKRRFLYTLSRSSYEKEWGAEYAKPGPGARLLAFLVRIFPKIGPFKSIEFQPPTAETEKLFMRSFNETVTAYRAHLEEVRAGTLRLTNRDLDTSRPTHPAEYELADQAYGKLLRDLAKNNFAGVPPDLRTDLLTFYQDPKPPAASKKKDEGKQSKTWTETLDALARLKSSPPPTPAL